MVQPQTQTNPDNLPLLATEHPTDPLCVEIWAEQSAEGANGKAPFEKVASISRNRDNSRIAITMQSNESYEIFNNLFAHSKKTVNPQGREVTYRVKDLKDDGLIDPLVEHFNDNPAMLRPVKRREEDIFPIFRKQTLGALKQFITGTVKAKDVEEASIKDWPAEHAVFTPAPEQQQQSY